MKGVFVNKLAVAVGPQLDFELSVYMLWGTDTDLRRGCYRVRGGTRSSISAAIAASAALLTWQYVDSDRQ